MTNEESREDKLLWEIIAIIHTFSGSIMLSAVSNTLVISSFFIGGILTFFINLLLIFFGVLNNKNTKIWYFVTFVLAILTILLFLLALFGLNLELTSIQQS